MCWEPWSGHMAQAQYGNCTLKSHLAMAMTCPLEGTSLTPYSVQFTVMNIEFKSCCFYVLSVCRGVRENHFMFGLHNYKLFAVNCVITLNVYFIHPL